MRDDDPEVIRLVAIALEHADRGEAADLESLCGPNEQLQHAVADALGLAPEVGRLQQEALATDRWLGTLLQGRYRLLERIGIGAMGLVYRGRDEQLGREIAVKLLRTDLLSGEAASARFEREAEVLASIDHTNVVTVYDRGRSQHGELFLVMELLRGIGLDRVIEAAGTEAKARGGVTHLVSMEWFDAAWSSLTDACRPTEPAKTWIASATLLCAGIADGLQAAHEAGVQHRDLKPSNVLLRSDGQPVLLDFGLAARDATATLATHDGTIGTPAYMAPEQAERGFTATAQSDVYGLGATLYHMLTLQLPYAGTMSQVLASLQRQEPVPANRIHHALPRDLQAILDCAMARRSKDRYPTAGAMAADLRAFLDYRPVSVRPLSTWQRTWRRLRRSATAQAVAATAALGLAAAGGYAAWLQHREGSNQIALAEHRHLPPDLSISRHPERRIIKDSGAKKAISARLDRIVAGSSHPLPARMQRAALRLDHGDPDGAAEDMRAIARACSSPFLSVLATRYEALAPTASQAADVDVAQLPDPATPEAHYVAAFLHLRRCSRTDLQLLLGDLEKVIHHLEAARGQTVPQAEELLIMAKLSYAILKKGQSDSERQRYQECLELAARAEGSLGGASATTCFVTATALVQLNRDDEALPRFDRLVELIPNHFGSRLNFASALRRVGRLAAAQQQLAEAVRIRPEDPKPYTDLVNLYCQSNQYERARMTARTAPSGSGAIDPNLTEVLLTRIDMRETIALFLGGAEQAAIAEQAGRALDRLARLPATGRRDHRTFDRTLLEAIASNDLSSTLTQLLDVLRASPNDWVRVRELLALWPKDLDQQQSTAAQHYLQALVDRMQPEYGDVTLPPTPVQPSSAQPSSATTNNK